MTAQPPADLKPDEGWSSDFPSIRFRCVRTPYRLFEDLAMADAPLRLVLFINGLPRAGKDTFCRYASLALAARGVVNVEISSIDPVRDLLRTAGFPVDVKTPEMRAKLSEVGATLERYHGFRSRHCIEAGRQLLVDNPHTSTVLFIHCREPEIIGKINEGLNHLGYQSRFILVDGPRGEQNPSNASDAGVLAMNYHDTVLNDSTLDAFQVRTERFVQRTLDELRQARKAR